MRKLGESFQLSTLIPEPSDIPGQAAVSFPLNQLEYLIGGDIRAWKGPSKPVHSPVLIAGAPENQARILGSFPLLDRHTALEALAAAVTAYDNGRGVWPSMSVAKRIEHMELFTRMMIDRRAQIVALIQWEVAKNLPDAEKEFDRTIEYIEATVGALKDLDNANSRFTTVDGTIAQIRRSPLGVVLCMGPYNYPLNETLTTLIPALIMGNTILLKPPKLGVLIYGQLLEAFQKAFPPGVVNTVYGQGEEVVPPLMESGRVSVLALIGSSKVADKLKKLHPKSNRLRAILGLDAKNPGIILPDADLNLAVKECLLGTLSFNGQRCTALKILLVHRSIAEQFVEKLSVAVNGMSIGMPWEAGVQITPVAEAGRVAYLAECIADAKAKGGAVTNAHGGEFLGTLFRPAVVYPVSPDMKLYQEEQFGPIIPVVPFDNVSEALEYVSESKYGQQVSVFGSDPAQIGSVADQLVNQVCRVNINAQCQRGPDIFPFTGRKDSGEGTLSVADALRAFSIRTMIAAKETAASKELLHAIVSGGHSNFIHTGFVF
ncbi:NAD-dependent aldehyde dehydrogenase [Polaromonas sp. CF318]|uniref:NADP-dependent glyceraldehyde-3-phosphate dehydrogenase n=1 Tax=Polaromonas sp. CF318 TaxID=1144318 RepID=UPI0002711F98|nr:NADP-dependent glyceraldehyde-3-phosphate dehydrogenase [Polaromonas sp. CF318]EJL77863.1 NAD-dependent aldehyde dehydrogenase [Polaromonas sp. CF318]